MSTILRKIAEIPTITIPALDGQATLDQANDVFAWIDSDFKNWGLDKPGKATPETQVVPYEQIQNATFVQMFGSLNPDLDKLVLSQDQIKQYCQDNRDKLRGEGCGNFFLFKVGDQFFVASVYLDSVGQLHVYVYRLGRGGVCCAEYGHRVVASQLSL